MLKPENLNKRRVSMNMALTQVVFLAPLRKKRLTILYYDLGRYYQLQSSFHRARSALWKAIRYCLLSVKPFLALLLSFLGYWGNWVFRVYRTAHGLGRKEMERFESAETLASLRLFQEKVG